MVPSDKNSTKNSEPNCETDIDQNGDKIISPNATITNMVSLPKETLATSSTSSEQNIRLKTLVGDSLCTLGLYLLKKVNIERNGAVINKTLITDGLEFVEIVEWNINSFSNFIENITLKFTNHFVKSVRSGNQYFIQMNKNNFTLLPQDKSSSSSLPFLHDETFENLKLIKGINDYLIIHFILLLKHLLKALVKDFLFYLMIYFCIFKNLH